MPVNTAMIKTNSIAVLVVTILCGLGLILYVAVFTMTLNLSESAEALKALVDVNAALIGFLAIIAVFVLTTNNNMLQSLDDETRRTSEEHKNNIRSILGRLAIEPSKTVNEIQDAENKEYEKKLENLDGRKKSIRSKSMSSLKWLVGSIVVFVISILSTLLAIGQVEAAIEVNSNLMYIAIFAMIIGIITIFYQIALLAD